MSEALVAMERLHGGQPVLRPQGEGWEGGAVSRAAVVYLHRSAESAAILRRVLRNADGSEPDLNSESRLNDGAVVLLYEARPAGSESSPETDASASIGLAVFSSGMELIKRLPDPILRPSGDPQGAEGLGVGNPRVTWINGAWWMTYDGMSAGPEGGGGEVRTRVCMARSSDLLHWERMGPVGGDLAHGSTSSGALLPEPVNNEYVLMYQSPGATSGGGALHMATTNNLDAPWRARGAVLSPAADSRYEASWISPGSAPVALGDRRYLIVYNAGHWVKRDELRRGTIGAAVLNLQHPRLDQPASVPELRLEPVLVPDGALEITGPARGGMANVLFTCGMFENQGNVVIVYSSGDAVLHAARVSRGELMTALENAGRAAPPAPSATSSSGSW